MAIDTAPKRRSVAHVARRWSGAGVTPEAAKPQFWRQCVGRGYGGILADAAAEAVNEVVNNLSVLFGMNINRGGI